MYDSSHGCNSNDGGDLARSKSRVPVSRKICSGAVRSIQYLMSFFLAHLSSSAYVVSEIEKKIVNSLAPDLEKIVWKIGVAVIIKINIVF